MKRIPALILAAIFLISACGSESGAKKRSSSNSNKQANSEANKSANLATPTPEMGGELLLTGTSESKTISCNERDVMLDEETTANKYNLTGECKSLTVDGVANTVYVDKVGEIKILGSSNKVYYVGGLDGKAPKISKKGVSLKVEKRKDIK